jgi:hypothetical protein
VETEEQRDLLNSTDTATQAQGFHFSKAVGADRAGEFLRQGRIAAVVKSTDEEHSGAQSRDPRRVRAYGQ